MGKYLTSVVILSLSTIVAAPAKAVVEYTVTPLGTISI
jgi:hypothetical protein